MGHYQGLEDAIEELEDQFELSTDSLKKVAHCFREEMNRGIQHEKANVPMLPSWIMQHPTGQESGEYLGLELSGKKKTTIYFTGMLIISSYRCHCTNLSGDITWKRSNYDTTTEISHSRSFETRSYL